MVKKQCIPPFNNRKWRVEISKEKDGHYSKSKAEKGFDPGRQPALAFMELLPKPVAKGYEDQGEEKPGQDKCFNCFRRSLRDIRNGG